MRSIDINPDNAEGYLYRARRTVEELAEGERVAARFQADSLLGGLFSMAAEEIPLSDEERIDLAAFELVSAEGRITPHLLARIKQVILNVAVARVFSGVVTCWSRPPRELRFVS